MLSMILRFYWKFPKIDLPQAMLIALPPFFRQAWWPPLAITLQGHRPGVPWRPEVSKIRKLLGFLEKETQLTARPLRAIDKLHVKSHTIVVAQANGCLPLHHRMMCSTIFSTALCCYCCCLRMSFQFRIRLRWNCSSFKIFSMLQRLFFAQSQGASQVSFCGRLTPQCPKVGDCGCSHLTFLYLRIRASWGQRPVEPQSVSQGKACFQKAMWVMDDMSSCGHFHWTKTRTLLSTLLSLLAAPTFGLRPGAYPAQVDVLCTCF